MEIEIARWIARLVHAGAQNRAGEPMIDHVERVADAVPEHLRSIAYLHDVLESSASTPGDLRCYGLTETESAALALLTRDADESYCSYVERIAAAPGCGGELARRVKLADLDDHLLRQTVSPGAPNYAWARGRIAAALTASPV